MTSDAEYRYITSNSVPDYYYNPYCPIGLGYGYCVQQEIDADMCMFPDLICGEDNGSGLSKDLQGDHNYLTRHFVGMDLVCSSVCTILLQL